MLRFLFFRPTKEDDRAPSRRRYRSLLRFERMPEDFGTMGEVILLGEAGTVRLSFWVVEELPPLAEGLQFEIRDGSRVVGRGQLLHV